MTDEDHEVGRWNHNIHYGRQLMRMIPLGVHDALYVGCGEGWLVRELRQRTFNVFSRRLDEINRRFEQASQAFLGDSS